MILFILVFPNKTYYLKGHVPNPIIFTFLDELKKNWKNIITHEIDSSINEIESTIAPNDAIKIYEGHRAG